jgi:hypothetical protein
MISIRTAFFLKDGSSIARLSKERASYSVRDIPFHRGVFPRNRRALTERRFLKCVHRKGVSEHAKPEISGDECLFLGIRSDGSEE